jgi:nucleoside-diphosphate-sugar epimerase
MRVLVTGAGGFSGPHLVSALLARGFEVTALTGSTPGRLAELEHPRRGLTVISGDLSRDLALPAPLDAVVHAASRSPLPGVTDEHMRHDNIAATEKLVAHARQSGVKSFIFFSSLSVYGRISTPIVDEATPIVEPDFYGATKRRGEEMLASEAKRFRSLSIRLPGIIGPRSVRNWMTGVMESAKAGKEISIYNPGQPFNNVVHVADLVAFAGDLLEREWTGADCVTVGATGEISVEQAVRMMVDAFGGRSRIKVAQAAKPGFTISSTRAVERYGYRPMEIRAMLNRFVGENGGAGASR